MAAALVGRAEGSRLTADGPASTRLLPLTAKALSHLPIAALEVLSCRSST